MACMPLPYIFAALLDAPRDGLCHVAREHAAEDEFHDGGARSGWDGVGDGLEPDQEDCRDVAVERYHRVPQSCR